MSGERVKLGSKWYAVTELKESKISSSKIDAALFLVFSVTIDSFS